MLKFIFATGSLLNILSKKKHLNLRDSAADKGVKFFALNNTRSLSTSVFPIGSGSNPSMTLFKSVYDVWIKFLITNKYD